MFREVGISDRDIEDRLNQVWTTLFFGPEDERISWTSGPDERYIVDTGNIDVRTEGMSYGMMMAVQRNDRKVFGQLWNWARNHMQHQSGPFEGYFAWSANLDGSLRAEGPASDGEEYFALALFFASHRWGEGTPPHDYAAQARRILREAVHKGEKGPGDPMWDPETALIRFVPNTLWTDPSYHLPHFYELFARWADPADRAFWSRAAQASRRYLVKACHPQTGLTPEYSEFDGSPHVAPWDYGHHHFYSDSYRVAANIGLDAAWFGGSAWHRDTADRILTFLSGQDRHDLRMYQIDGTPLAEPALHPLGLVATTAMGALATDSPLSREAVERFWNEPLRTGPRRYYDNCLAFFALLALAGQYRIWAPR
jgi:oligosaccharide reducing-end xylanase